jgi:hypothetical protein
VIAQLDLRDATGQAISLRHYFHDYLLLIFLRHLA